jgi:hypothetical protein
MHCGISLRLGDTSSFCAGLCRTDLVLKFIFGSWAPRSRRNNMGNDGIWMVLMGSRFSSCNVVG